MAGGPVHAGKSKMSSNGVVWLVVAVLQKGRLLTFRMAQMVWKVVNGHLAFLRAPLTKSPPLDGVVRSGRFRILRRTLLRLLLSLTPAAGVRCWKR